MISERRQIAERYLSEGNGDAARIRGNRQSYRSLITKNTTLVLSTESDLFKFMKTMTPAGQR